MRVRRQGDASGQAGRPVEAGQRQIAEIQRARIVGAMLELASERGATSVSVADVVARSGVSRRTFYDLFVDREDCFHAAFEQAIACASERVIVAYLGGKSWRERIRAALSALLDLFDAEPQIGLVLVNESLAGGPKTLERRAEVIAKLTGIVEQGARETRSGAALPALTGEGIVGGALAVIQRCISEKPRGPLIELTNPLMGMIVLPYLGASAARRELERPLPKRAAAAGREKQVPTDPFKAAGMRLTYRTVRVLVAIADNPGASNRLIADAEQIKDQGQISKLLARLERVGMIANTYPTPGKGAPNSWTLTESGRQVVVTIEAHSVDRMYKRGDVPSGLEEGDSL
ncbi:MAG: TetR/AcrR family transcriptional regulator [Solirubrobacteraceae bacterium]